MDHGAAWCLHRCQGKLVILDSSQKSPADDEVIMLLVCTTMSRTHRHQEHSGRILHFLVPFRLSLPLLLAELLACFQILSEAKSSRADHGGS
jgi:hypothetical protein